MSFCCNKHVYKTPLPCINVLIIDATSILTEFLPFMGVVAEFLLFDHLLDNA